MTARRKRLPTGPQSSVVAATCHTCRYFVMLNAKLGQCRRHAPVVSTRPTETLPHAAAWPTVRAEDWCGDYEQFVKATAGSLAAIPFGEKARRLLAKLGIDSIEQLTKTPISQLRREAGSSRQLTCDHIRRAFESATGMRMQE